MNLHKLSTIALGLTFSSTVFAQTTLIKNVNGYTINNNELVKFHAIQITDDKIDKIFTQSIKVPTNLSASITIQDAKGKTMLPGLIDAHGHVLSYGNSLMQADLLNTQSEQAGVERAQIYAKANPSVSWITGRGWNQVQWQSKEFPTAQSLDKAFPDKPVWLRRVDGHAGWANSKAMEIAGITAETKSPDGGEIIRDKNGKPTGVFIDNAMDLIAKNIAPLTQTQLKSTLVKAMNSLASMGLTSVHDAGIDTENLKANNAITNENNMPTRINAMLYLPSENWQQTIDKGAFNSKDHLLNFNSVKIQADGALGSRGAALIEDYSDHAGHKGLLLHDSDSLNHYIDAAMKGGLQVNTHAIGDNANKIVLDAYESAIKANKSKALRHRVEHAQVLRIQDIPRFDELGIIASMQATHATSDKNMAQDRLGEERILGAYAWRKLLNANAVIAAGSDFPVESPNPFFGLHASVTRQDKQNSPEGGWFADEKMTRFEALKSFTIDAAYSGHQEKLLGSLAPGKKADFIILKDDYYKSNETQLWQNQVIETWVNGKQVFNAK